MGKVPSEVMLVPATLLYLMGIVMLVFSIATYAIWDMAKTDWALKLFLFTLLGGIGSIALGVLIARWVERRHVGALRALLSNDPLDIYADVIQYLRRGRGYDL